MSFFSALHILHVSKYVEQEGVKISTTSKQKDEDHGMKNLIVQNPSSTPSIALVGLLAIHHISHHHAG